MARQRIPSQGTKEENKAARLFWGKVWRDNAEAWWEKQGKVVPLIGTPEYLTMYNAWLKHMRED